MQDGQDLRWWKSATPHEPLFALFAEIRQRQSYRHEQLVRNLRLYGDRRLAGSWPWQWARPERSVESSRGPRLSLNIVRSCVDSAVAKLGKDHPRPMFLTSGGDWSLQRRAEERGKFVDGLFEKAGLYDDEEPRALLDTALHGTGCIKVVERWKEVHFERTFLGELWTEDIDSMYGAPRSLYQAKLYDRAVAAELWPSAKAAIRDAQSAPEGFFMRDPRGDQIVVLEAWHLPSSPTATDGRHVAAIVGKTLFDEKWTSQRYPFGFEHWGRDPLGFWATGLGHLLAGKQYEINQVLRTIAQNIYLGGNLKVFVERGAKITKSHLSNDLRGVVVEYSGRPPVYFAGDVVSPQLFQHLQGMVQASFEESGISQLSASSRIPAGLEASGRAMLVYSQLESERFSRVQLSREAMFCDLAELSLEAASRIYKREGSLAVKYRTRSWLEPIDFADIEMDPDDYEVDVFPTAFLPREPAARLAVVQQMLAAGMIDQQRAARLLDFPDLEAEEDLETAPIRLINQRLERMVKKGERLPPHPRMDLQLAKRRALLAYQQAELEGAPPDRLEILGEFIDQAMNLLGEAGPDAAATQGADAAELPPPPALAPIPQPVAPMAPGALPAQGA